MKNNPLVSIIMPAYNSEKYIEEAINSVINQTYKNWELIVVDDGSTDKTKEIVQQCIDKDKRIKLIKIKQNFGGPAHPRNIGIKESRGKYIAFLDSDDIWLKNKLEIQLEKFQLFNVDIVCSYCYLIDQKGKIFGKVGKNYLYNILKKINLKDKKIIIYTNFININSAIIKKDKILNYFDTDVNLVALEDWMFWIEILQHDNKMYICKEYLLKYRIHEQSISKRKNINSYKKAFFLYKKLLNSNYINILDYLLLLFLNYIRIFKRISYNLFKYKKFNLYKIKEKISFI